MYNILANLKNGGEPQKSNKINASVYSPPFSFLIIHIKSISTAYSQNCCQRCFIFSHSNSPQPLIYRGFPSFPTSSQMDWRLDVFLSNILRFHNTIQKYNITKKRTKSKSSNFIQHHSTITFLSTSLVSLWLLANHISYQICTIHNHNVFSLLSIVHHGNTNQVHILNYLCAFSLLLFCFLHISDMQFLYALFLPLNESSLILFVPCRHLSR